MTLFPATMATPFVQLPGGTRNHRQPTLMYHATTNKNETTRAAEIAGPAWYSQSEQSSDDPSSSRRRRIRSCTKAKVCFNTQVKLRLCTALTDYTEEERNASWHSPLDCDRMRSEILQELRRWEAKIHEQSSTSLTQTTQDDDCIRGLESRFRDATNARLRQRRRLAKAVLAEQETQYSIGYYDPDTIADLSFSISAPDVLRARARGIQDVLDL